MALLKFVQNPEYYYDKALNCLENGDYVNGIDGLYETMRVINELDTPPQSVDLEEVSLNLADAYLEMGQPSCALREYFRALSMGGDFSTEIEAGICESYRQTGYARAASFYALSVAKNDPELINELFSEFAHKDRKPDIRLLEKNDSFVGKQFTDEELSIIDEFNFDKSAKDKTEYIETRAFLSVVFLQREDYESALDNATEAMRVADGEIFPRALSAYVYIFFAIDSIETVQDEINKLNDYESDDYEDNIVLASLTSQIGEEQLALKFATTALNKEPYSKEALLIKMQALYNIGEVAKAKSEAVKLCKIFREDPLIRIYAQKINSGDDDAKSFPPSLVGKDRAKAYNVAETIIENPDLAFDAYNNEEEYFSICYVLDNAYEELQIKLGLALSKSKIWSDYLEDKLLDPELSPFVKGYILFGLITEQNLKEIQAVPTFMFRTEKFALPKNVEMQTDETKKAYALAYSLMLCADAVFEKELKSAYKKLVPCIKESYDYKVIAAYLSIMTRVEEVFTEWKNVASIFLVDEEEINRLHKEVSDNSKKTQNKRRIR